jgi:hypothetical protein
MEGASAETGPPQRVHVRVGSRTDISFGGYGVCFVAIVLKKSFGVTTKSFQGC